MLIAAILDCHCFANANELSSLDTAPAQALTDAQKAQQSENRRIIELDSMIKKAEEEEAKDSLYASYYWLELATAQAKNGSCNAAIKNASHGLDIHKKIGDGCAPMPTMIPDTQRPNVLRYGILRGSFGHALARCGHSDDAEKLLREAVKKANEVYGPDSSVAANQQCQLTIFLVNENMDSEALKALDELLSLNPRLLDVGYPSAITQICELCEMLTKRGKNKIASTMLNKILFAQREAYGPKDERVAATLAALAKADESLGRNEEAVTRLAQCVSISILYGGMMSNYNGNPLDTRHLRWRLLQALKKTSGDAEAERIYKLTDGKYLATTQGEREKRHRLMNTEGISRKKRIIELQKLFDIMYKKCPFGHANSEVLNDLITLALYDENWIVLVKAASARIELYEHTYEPTAGRHWGCVVDRYKRMDFYKIAAEANLHLGNKTEAKALMSRAVRTMPDITKTELETASKILAACDDT